MDERRQPLGSRERGAEDRWLPGVRRCDGGVAPDDPVRRRLRGVRRRRALHLLAGRPYAFGVAGLTVSDGTVHFNTMDFALRFNANDTVDVMENGQYQGGDSYYQP